MHGKQIEEGYFEGEAALKWRALTAIALVNPDAAGLVKGQR
jgi:hypothetical protein